MTDPFSRVRVFLGIGQGSRRSVRSDRSRIVSDLSSGMGSAVNVGGFIVKQLGGGSSTQEQQGGKGDGIAWPLTRPDAVVFMRKAEIVCHKYSTVCARMS